MDHAARKNLDLATRVRMLEDAVWDGSPGGAPPIVGRDAIFGL